MSHPEIARRCHACGASIRDRAFFCPQCGISLAGTERAETQALNSERTETPVINGETAPTQALNSEHMETPVLNAETAATQALNGEHAATQSLRSENAETEALSSEHGATQPIRSEHVEPTARQTVESNRKAATNDTLPLQPPPTRKPRTGGSAPNYGKGPATTRRLEPRDGVIQRVEKLRKISTVVIDQAAYDPSLRFILVAGFLFLIFVLILIISRFIG